MQHFMSSLTVPVIYSESDFKQRPHCKAKIQNKFANYWGKKLNIIWNDSQKCHHFQVLKPHLPPTISSGKRFQITLLKKTSKPKRIKKIQY